MCFNVVKLYKNIYKNSKCIQSQYMLFNMNYFCLHHLFILLHILVESKCYGNSELELDKPWNPSQESYIIKNRRKRVMGGALDLIENVPYLVAIWIREDEINHYSLCGGTIINSEWVLTAAHCCFTDDTQRIQIKSGSENILNGYARNRYIDQVVRYGDFNNVTLEHDICLLKVTQPFVWDDKHQPAKMYEDGEKIDYNDYGTVAGYGRSGASPKKLRENFTLRTTTLPIVSPTDCSKIYSKKPSRYLGPETFCAGYGNVDIQKDVCIGDSGGPFTIDKRLAGIVSWGSPCYKIKRNPGVYTKISYYRKWIDRISRLAQPGVLDLSVKTTDARTCDHITSIK